MTINPNDPWYPSPYKEGENCPHMSEKGTGGCPACLGVTIRLKLAEAAMRGFCANPATYHLPLHELLTMALTDADGLIERMNSDEGKQG